MKKAKAEATILIGKLDGLSGSIEALVVTHGTSFLTAQQAGAQDHLIDTTALLPVVEDGFTMAMPPGDSEDPPELSDDEA